MRATLATDAQEARQDVARRLFELEQAEALGAAFSGFCGKLTGLWGRLALLLSQIEPDGLQFIVSIRTAERATRLMFESVLPNAARVYAAMHT
jgi:hypothetical protein